MKNYNNNDTTTDYYDNNAKNYVNDNYQKNYDDKDFFLTMIRIE